MIFEWDESFDVGVERFNQQHRHFFAISNTIYNLVEIGNINRETLMPRVLELTNYADYHLLAEETVFLKYGYPKTEEHIKAHNFYRQKIQEYLEKTMSENVDFINLAKQLADFASDWLFNHIRSVDKQYSSFLKGKEN